MVEKTWFQMPADFQFLVDSGLLFEINRTIMNPVGLALTLIKKPDGTLALSEKLKDFRSEPEKALIDVANFENGKRKLDDFMKEFGYGQLDKRRDKLGFGTQDYSSQAQRRTKLNG